MSRQLCVVMWDAKRLLLRQRCAGDARKRIIAQESVKHRMYLPSVVTTSVPCRCRVTGATVLKLIILISDWKEHKHRCKKST